MSCCGLELALPLTSAEAMATAEGEGLCEPSTVAAAATVAAGELAAATTAVALLLPLLMEIRGERWMGGSEAGIRSVNALQLSGGASNMHLLVRRTGVWRCCD